MGTTQEQFNVGGMSCSFCAESIEKAYARTDGVEDVDVSLAHEEVLVQYDDGILSEIEVKDTLRDLGYTIRDPDKAKRYEQQQAELADGKRRLLLAGSASIVVAALMGWMLLVMGRFESASLAMDLVTLGLALGTMVGPGRYIKQKAFQSLRRGIFNQHVLLEAGAFAGLLGGVLGLFVFPSFPTVHFFAVSVFITTYHILSEYTSLIVRTRASQAVQSLLDLQPDTARRVTDSEARSVRESQGDSHSPSESRRDSEDASGRSSGRSPREDDGDLEEVPVDAIDVGDQVRIKPGENVPVDGVVIDGSSTVDESVATGESIPQEKTEGDEVIGGSVNGTGTLLVAVTATGEDAFLNQVAREIEEARAMKPGIIQLADRVLKYFVPGVLTIAMVSFAFWLLGPLAWGGGPNVQRGAFAALAVLVLGYPCALGMATPLALVRGGGKAANHGILMRSGDAFQIFPDVDRIVLDKTGTITVGEPAVSETVGTGEEATDVLATAASAETFSEHPLADAILDRADDRGVTYADPESFDSVTGKGVRATVDGDDIRVGKPGWLEAEGVSLADAGDEIERLQRRGLTVSGVVRDGDLVGLIGIGDEIKADAAETVQRITDAGITPVMITGDNERTAQAVADEVGIERVMADVLPDEKREEIGRLQDGGERTTGSRTSTERRSDGSHRVAMVGDGINDAPALTQADIGIAIGAGTDVAIESADIVLMGERLGGVMDAYEIGQESYRKTRQNLATAFAFNGIGVAAATTGLVHPVFAMIAMALSVSAVLANSFGGQLLSGEGVTTEFAVEGEESTEIGDGQPAGD